MLDIKKIAVAAGVGFVLSLLIGVLMRHAMSSVLLRAILTGALFALVAAVVLMICGNFLGFDQANATQDIVSDSEKVGGVVDITLADEELDDDNLGLSFNVGKHVMKPVPQASLRKPVVENQEQSPNTPVTSKAPSSPALETKTNAKQFTPVNLSDKKPLDSKEKPVTPSANNSSDKLEEKQQEIVENSSDNVEKIPQAEKKASVMDDLPDIGDVMPSLSDDDYTESESDIQAQEDFEEAEDASPPPKSFTPSYPTMSPKKKEIPQGLDNAKELAQAIRTVLVKDGS